MVHSAYRPLEVLARLRHIVRVCQQQPRQGQPRGRLGSGRLRSDAGLNDCLETLDSLRHQPGRHWSSVPAASEPAMLTVGAAGIRQIAAAHGGHSVSSMTDLQPAALRLQLVPQHAEAIQKARADRSQHHGSDSKQALLL